MIKKKLGVLLIGLTLIVTGCSVGASKDSVNSSTGRIVVEKNGSSKEGYSYKLNHVEGTLPPGYEIETMQGTDPYGMSIAQISKDGKTIGFIADGNTDGSDYIEAAKIIFSEAHGIDESIGITEADVVKTPTLTIIPIGLSDGQASVIFKTGTDKYVYTVVNNNDTEAIMANDVMDNILTTFGSREDYNFIYNDNTTTTTNEPIPQEEPTAVDLSPEDEAYIQQQIDALPEDPIGDGASETDSTDSSSDSGITLQGKEQYVAGEDFQPGTYRILNLSDSQYITLYVETDGNTKIMYNGEGDYLRFDEPIELTGNTNLSCYTDGHVFKLVPVN